MRETKTETIGDYIYDTNQLGALEGRKLFLRLTKKIAPLFLAGKQQDAGQFESLFDPAEIEFLCDTFAKVSWVTGKEYGDKKPMLKDVFDLHFAGKYEDMFRWLWFCVDANFGSFLASVGISKEKMLEGAQKVASA